MLKTKRYTNLVEIPQELDRLLEAQEMETAVHERAHAFLDERIVHLQDQKDVWAKEQHAKHMGNAGGLRVAGGNLRRNGQLHPSR